MKTLLIALALISALVLVSPASVSAATNPGVKPGSFFYVFDRGLENISLFFTFNRENKAKKSIEYANERLAEAEAIANDGRADVIEKTINDYQESISLALKNAQEVEDKKKSEDLFKLVSEKTAEHQRTLISTVNKLPDEKKEVLVKALEASRKGQAEAMQHISVLNEEIKAIQEQIEKLKQETTIDSGSAEVEKLKKEIENLKNKSNTAQTPIKTVVKDNTSKISQLAPKTQPISSASSNIKEKINYVVQIVCPVKGGTSSGTGGMIYGNSSSDSKILTNKHVLTGATGPCGIYRTQSYESTPVLYFKSGTSFVFSKDYDLAIITPDVKTLTSYLNTNFPFNQSTDVFNKNILVLGYPSSAGNNITLTKGAISGSENINGVVMYKTDAKIDNGNSGGTVFDEDGKFMGVPTLASQGNFASYGYIIPAQIVKNFLDLVEQEGYGKQNWQHPQLSLYAVSPSNTVPDLAPRTPQNPAPQPQEDSSLKIARCQAKRDADYSTFVSKANQMIADGVQKIKDEAKTVIDEQLRLYDACLIERPEVLKQYDSTMSPYYLCSFYLRNAEAKKTYTDQLVAKTRASRDTFLPQGKVAVDNEYYQCVNR